MRRVVIAAFAIGLLFAVLYAANTVAAPVTRPSSQTIEPVEGCRFDGFTFECDLFVPIVVSPPPSLSSLVIQLVDMPSYFTVDSFREITNEEAADGYPDPVVALTAFQSQGRESSWYTLFLTRTPYSDAWGVSDQVVRFTTVEGANAGINYVIEDEFRRSPGYLGPYSLGFGEHSGYYVRRYTNDGASFLEFFLVMRKEYHAAFVRVVGPYANLDASEARSYARKAYDQLP